MEGGIHSPLSLRQDQTLTTQARATLPFHVHEISHVIMGNPIKSFQVKTFAESIDARPPQVREATAMMQSIGSMYITRSPSTNGT